MIMQLNDPNEWTYFSEGGKNAVFAYHPNSIMPNKDSDDSIYSTTPPALYLNHHDASKNCIGHVLRVSKKDLAMSSLHYKIDSLNENENINTMIVEAEFTDILHNGFEIENKNTYKYVPIDDINRDWKKLRANIWYQQKVIRPKLGEQYLDIPKPVQFSYRFLAILRYRAMNENRIPKSRLKDWSPSKKWKDDFDSKMNHYKATVCNRMCFGALYKNYTMLQSFPYTCDNVHHKIKKEFKGGPIQYSNFHSCISIEIKPKAVSSSKNPLILVETTNAANAEVSTFYSHFIYQA